MTARACLSALLLVACGPLWASRFDCSLEPPRQAARLIHSYAPLLSAGEEERLNQRLIDFANETSNQVLVLIVDTLCGTEASDLAFQVGERWGVGQKGFDNGVVILTKPTGGQGQRRIFIATGYGLEGALPDATCKRIVEEEMKPRFKQGAFAEGIHAALDVIFPLAKGEFSHARYERESVPWGSFIIASVVLMLVLLNWRSRVRSYARINKLDFWSAMWLMSQMSRKHPGRWSPARTSGGFGGGVLLGGGGGFGGFGGGGFGGGGAGGSW
ncbi:MAG: TPM domain-containing protein [Flavobacteriales bacterium]